ncbi:hypothetical protein FJZ36_00580 [Candidatus Poribacteria bacterium]|nr:hypothetical protein [Candidatus Poribacteria bacterium]
MSERTNGRWAATAVLLLITLARTGVAAAGPSAAELEELAAVGSGFVVWESNRTGLWRIWMRDLDGSPPRQLSPEEPGRNHFSPMISPDGKRLVYISYPRGDAAHLAARSAKAPLYLVDMATGERRVLVENARNYGGDRSAVWLSDEALAYIDGDGVSQRFDVRSGTSTPLTTQGHPENGWLINATMTRATRGHPAQFALYDAKSRQITEQPAYGGCEAYFSHDGVWGYWMAGAGGPVNRVRLSTNEPSTILALDDARLPPERNYVYFPHFSSDGRLFTFAASPDQHDHDNSDYDVFVAPSDPATLEIVGKPVRMTFDAGVDRYPNVFVAPLELGRHRGEVPLTITFPTPPGGRVDSWGYGDGATGKSARHTYATPGTYVVRAVVDGIERRGRVEALPAEPPRVLRSVLRGRREVVVVFDEPVTLNKPGLRFDSGRRVESWSLDDSGTQLTIRTRADLGKEDTLAVEGVFDRAQKPNRMKKQAVTVRRPTWPVSRDGLVFAWKTADDRDSGTNVVLRPRGRGVLTGASAMWLANGAFIAPDSVSAAILDRLRATSALTLEATIMPASDRQSGPARIATFSTDSGSRNFTLGQDGARLVFRLRTPKTGTNGVSPEVQLFDVPASEPTHVVVTYVPGRLIAYRNGETIIDTNVVQGGFDNWSTHRFLFGDEWSGERDWSGALEGVAVYDRALSPNEALGSYEAYRNILFSRAHRSSIDVEAVLMARSDVPSVQEIAPYREALVAAEYRVVGAGEATPERIRLVEWGILDSSPLRLPSGGDPRRLVLEPLDANPQLSGVYTSDTLEPDPDVPYYYVVP